jgi:hypothetical protein
MASESPAIASRNLPSVSSTSQRPLDAFEKRRFGAIAPGRAALGDDAAGIGEDGLERAADAADVLVEFVLGVPELQDLEPTNDADRIAATGRKAGGPAQPAADMFQALPRTIAGLQRDDRAACGLGDLLGAASGEFGELNTLALLRAQLRMGRDQSCARGMKLRAIQFFELPVPGQGRVDGPRQQFLIARAAFDRLLHRPSEFEGLRGEILKALTIAVERGGLDPGAAGDDGDGLDMLEQGS